MKTLLMKQLRLKTMCCPCWFPAAFKEVRDRRSTDERAKRSGIKIEKNLVENGALWNSAGKMG